MRRSVLWSLAVLGLASVMVGRQQAIMGDLFYGKPAANAVVLTKADAVLVLPPTSIGNNVFKAEWSPTGEHVLMLRSRQVTTNEIELSLKTGQPPNMETLKMGYLSAWNRKSGKAIEIARIDLTRFDEWKWFANQDVAIGFIQPVMGPEPARTPGTVQAGQPQQAPVLQPSQIAWITPATGQMRVLNLPTTVEYAVVTPAPLGNLAMAVTVSGSAGKQTVYVLDSTGRLVQSIAMGEREYVTGWLTDGLKFQTAMMNRTSNGVTTRERFHIDAQTGTRVLVQETSPLVNQRLEGVAEGNPAWKTPEQPELFVASQPLPKRPGNAETRITLVIGRDGKEETSVPIGTDIVSSSLSPKSDAVLFTHFGIAEVREFIRMPKDMYLKMRDAALRTEAINKAKQVATAFFIYGADYDDEFPTNENWQDKIMPYLKNRDIMDGFDYIYPGGKMSDIKNVAETVIGHVRGPGGRAEAYADGHVKWIADPKP